MEDSHWRTPQIATHVFLPFPVVLKYPSERPASTVHSNCEYSVFNLRRQLTVSSSFIRVQVQKIYCTGLSSFSTPGIDHENKREQNINGRRTQSRRSRHRMLVCNSTLILGGEQEHSWPYFELASLQSFSRMMYLYCLISSLIHDQWAHSIQF